MPKQFLDLMGLGRTMLQLTYDRFRNICEPSHFVVVTNERYKTIVHEQLPDVPLENILCEPFRRNTAPCIAFANAFIKQRDSDAIVIVTPSDHLITSENLFIESINTGIRFVSESDDTLLTIGVRAHRPETAFGYIQVGDTISDQYKLLNNVKTFTEKPNEEMAKIFYDCGEFCWNTGVFIWRVSSIERALSKYMPNVQSQFDALDAIPSSHWTKESITRVYEECENVSIDYGVMEKARNVYVQQTEALWADLGSWDSIYEQASKDDFDNALIEGNAILKDSKGCLVRIPKEKTVIADSLNNYVIIERDGVIFICPRDKAHASWKYKAEMKAAESIN